MTTQPKRALIVGSGVAGPVAAMFLKRAGIEAAIYEAHPEPDDYAGLFLNLASNGRGILATLGLDGDVAAAGFACPRMVMWSGNGKRLGEMRNGAAESQGAESVIIKRGDLQRILREAAVREGIPIAWDKQLVSITTGEGAAVRAHFADGSSAEGDVLVGCDGLNSRVRRIVDPQAPAPSYTGLVSCGGFARSTTLPSTPGTQHFVFGERAFFGYLVKPNGEIYWFNNLAYPGTPRRSELEAIPQAEWREQLLALHRNDQPFIGEIIRATEGAIGRYPIYDIPTLPRWHAGPVVLIGDAAHATSPSAGQGASLALEDAIVLAQCMRDIPRVEDAFAAYEQLRRARAEKVVRASRRTGNNKAASNQFSRWLRDLMLPFFLKRLSASRSLDWLYSYRVAWETPVTVSQY
ncbi:MAG TPA: NAD(P)/FAD-dependent oxidoreductase [Roseiflexaceae bacterium]|nr:NAD(P)/FAD-dependent oxidoreductase [Roseiflexaceae bacterium]